MRNHPSAWGTQPSRPPTVPTIGDPELLRSHRVTREGPRIRSEIAARLRGLATQIEADDVEGGHPDGVYVVVTGDDAPTVTHAGEVTWAGYREAAQILQDAASAGIVVRGLPARTIDETVADGHRRRRTLEAQNAQALAARLAARPWQCENPGCEARFETERGANQHEDRHCRYRP